MIHSGRMIRQQTFSKQRTCGREDALYVYMQYVIPGNTCCTRALYGVVYYM
jgi:hypothetical protein